MGDCHIYLCSTTQQDVSQHQELSEDRAPAGSMQAPRCKITGLNRRNTVGKSLHFSTGLVACHMQ